MFSFERYPADEAFVTPLAVAAPYREKERQLLVLAEENVRLRSDLRGGKARALGLVLLGVLNGGRAGEKTTKNAVERNQV